MRARDFQIVISLSLFLRFSLFSFHSSFLPFLLSRLKMFTLAVANERTRKGNKSVVGGVTSAVLFFQSWRKFVFIRRNAVRIYLFNCSESLTVRFSSSDPPHPSWIYFPFLCVCVFHRLVLSPSLLHFGLQFVCGADKRNDTQQQQQRVSVAFFHCWLPLPLSSSLDYWHFLSLRRGQRIPARWPPRPQF